MADFSEIWQAPKVINDIRCASAQKTGAGIWSQINACVTDFWSVCQGLKEYFQECFRCESAKYCHCNFRAAKEKAKAKDAAKKAQKVTTVSLYAVSFYERPVNLCMDL